MPPWKVQVVVGIVVRATEDVDLTLCRKVSVAEVSTAVGGGGHDAQGRRRPW